VRDKCFTWNMEKFSLMDMDSFFNYYKISLTFKLSHRAKGGIKSIKLNLKIKTERSVFIFMLVRNISNAEGGSERVQKAAKRSEWESES
jgi:hypothetical protein